MSEQKNQNNQKKSDLTELGALWLKKSNNGTSYLRGKVSNPDKTISYDVMIFKNEYKNSDNQPDYRIYTDLKKSSTATPTSNGSASGVKPKLAAQKPAPSPPVEVDETSDEEIPF